MLLHLDLLGFLVDLYLVFLELFCLQPLCWYFWLGWCDSLFGGSLLLDFVWLFAIVCLLAQYVGLALKLFSGSLLGVLLFWRFFWRLWLLLNIALCIFVFDILYLDILDLRILLLGSPSRSGCGRLDFGCLCSI